MSEGEPFARTTDELLAKTGHEKSEPLVVDALDDALARKRAQRGVIEERAVPEQRYRDALKRAGVRPDLLRLVPDTFVFTLGTRLLRQERTVAELGQKLTLRAEANTQRTEPWQVMGFDELRLASEVHAARHTLVGMRYGVEAALGVLAWQKNQEMEEK